IKMGEPKANFDKSEFRRRVARLVAQNLDASLQKISSGNVVLQIQRIGADCWFRQAPEFTMIAKALLNLDRVVYALDPSFNPNEVIRQESTNIMVRQTAQSVEPGALLARAVEVKEFAERLPMRVNKILDAV